jgi:DNA-binding NarL/FixJ family response regulator
MDDRLRILLVDDQATVRYGLRMRLGLEAEWSIVGEAGNAAEALELAQELAPDVVVMDIQMPEMDGIAATERLLAQSPQVKVIVLSICGDHDTRSRARAAGAVAFVEKHGGVEHLLDEIRQVARGPSAQPCSTTLPSTTM